jgi:starch synthase
MDILFATTELAPFVKVGGLADVVAALTKSLRALGHKVTIALPRFPALEAGGLLVARRLTPLKVTLGDRSLDVTVFDGRLASQVDLVLVDAPGLYDRGGVYGERGEDYDDNALRFAVLSRAVVELARQREQAGQAFDAVHCHDWPTALAAVYAKRTGLATPIVLTLHNVAHQGVFAKDALATLGLGPEELSIDRMEFYGGVNVLKGGVLAADAVTTVSPSYAREIQTPEGGHRLEGVLASRGERLVGIVNGVDYGVWNPASDPALAARYDAEDPAPKARCKGALQRELGLALEVDAPLVACVGRMVHQKGMDLVAAAMPRMLRAADAQCVVAGDGDQGLMSALDAACKKSDGRAVFVPAASEAVVHRVFAAADVVLVPSRFEPCGLVQMYAQRYGALPVARATGGLKDTIVDCDAKLETGTGFLFDEDTADALLGAVERAFAARVGGRWPALVRRVMKLDRGWERPARQYEQLYRSVTRDRRA